VSEKQKSSAADWLTLLAAILGVIAAVLGAGPSLLGYDSPRAMTCDIAGVWCKASP
jgi:hypothetical protein